MTGIVLAGLVLFICFRDGRISHELHIGAADQKGHIHGQNAERSAVDGLQKIEQKAVGKAGNKSLVCVDGEGLQDQSKGAVCSMRLITEKNPEAFFIDEYP